ncbi:MAG: hypothetical protein ACOYJK_09805, partial [Prevotella sp.]
MGFWQKIVRYFQRENADAVDGVETDTRLGDYTRFFDFMGNGTTALSVATVYRCVQLLSESVANLPLLYMRLKDGIFVTDTNSRLHYLLTVQPDYTRSAFDFWKEA